MKKKIAMVVLWLAALVCCLCLADHFMRRDDSARKYGPFFEDKKGFDVLFFGTSRVLDGITPMELWRDYGITSYNMGNNSEPLGMTKWTLDLASDVHLPKVAVFDVFYVDHAVDEAWTFSFRHMFYDALPLSRRKIEAVRATQGEDGMLEFLMPDFDALKIEDANRHRKTLKEMLIKYELTSYLDGMPDHLWGYAESLKRQAV